MGKTKSLCISAETLMNYKSGNLDSLVRINAHASLPFGAFKLHLPVAHGEQGEIAADAYVHSGIKLIAALADDDAAGANDFAAVSLDASHLRLGVAAVSR